ncbi:uncharacterized protein LOC134228424 [Saccostrea cucullata]|uniref:uncharacterized protein LOC134228424 n=1 Tax=Saccostrea cuccullata TaxID=36930 RepID=UPI002ED18BAC
MQQTRMTDLSPTSTSQALSCFFYTNSKLAPTCILFMSIVIMMIFSTSKSIPKPRPVVWGTEAIMTFISMFFTFLVWFLVHRNRRRYLRGQILKDVSQNVKLVFLWIFGLGNILNSGINMAVNIDCLIYGGPQPFEGEQSISILCHLTEIFFCVGQLGFLSLYGTYRFKSSSLINYGISFMVIAHLLRWCRTFFDSILRESKSSLSNETYINDCFYNSTIVSIRHMFNPYVEPIISEYCLLSVAIAIKMFITFDFDPCLHTEESTRRLEDTCSCSDTENSSTTSWNMVEMQRRRNSFFLSIGSGIILSLPFAVAYFLLGFNNHNMPDIYRIIRIPYDLMVLFLLCFGYRQFNVQFHENLRRQRAKPINHPVLTFVTAGAIAYTTFGCIAGIMFLHQSSGRALLADKIIQAIGILFQTKLILHVQTFVFKDATVRVTFFKVHSIFLCVFVMNIIHWTLTTFGSRKPKDTMHLEVDFYGEDYLRVIMQMMFPIMLFYRFLTAIEMYELYKKTDIYR